MQRRLSVFKVVDEWHKSRSDNRPAEGLLGRLTQSFWDEQIKLYQPGSQTAASRELFLKGLHEVAEGSGVVFYESEPPDRTVYESDGTITYDRRTQVVLPADAREWSTDVLERAYAILAGAPVDHYPRRFLQAFRAHEIDRDEFGELCDKRGWRRPSFWFGDRVRKTAPIIDPECRAWLATQLQGPREHPKAHYAKIAQERFGTPLRRFNRIWADLAPKSRRKPGRPHSKSKQ